MSSTTPNNSSPKPSEEAAPVAVGTHGIDIDDTAPTKPISTAAPGTEKKALNSLNNPENAAKRARVEKDEVTGVSRETGEMELGAHDVAEQMKAGERSILVATKLKE